MAIIKEDFVSFEVAKLLKDKGFIKPCQHYYFSNGKISEVKGLKHRNSPCINTFSAPTLQMTKEWLEEVYGLIISIEYQDNCSTWKWRVYINSSNKKHTDFQHYDKSETACEIALKYCLKYLIK